MEFFDILANRSSGRFPANPPEKFMTQDTLRDIDSQHYLIVDQEQDISDGNLGAVTTIIKPTLIDREGQTTEEKEAAYDSTISEPSLTREGNEMSLFNPFGGDAGDAIDAAAEKAEAERLAAAVAEQMGRQGADVVADQYEDPPLVGINNEYEDHTYQAEPPDMRQPSRSPLANLWFLGAIGIGLFFVLGGKK